MIEEILQKMKSEVNVSDYGNNKICISFVGGPGYGKSTISKMLCKKMNLFHTSTDVIRRYLEKLNVDVTDYDKTTELVSSIAFPFQDFLFQNNIDFVLDANLMLYLDILKKRCEHYGYNLFIIEIEINPQNALERVVNRSNEIGLDNLSTSDELDFKIFLNQLSDYKKIENPEFIFAKINTETDDVEKQVDLIIKKIQTEISSNI